MRPTSLLKTAAIFAGNCGAAKPPYMARNRERNVATYGFSKCTKTGSRRVKTCCIIILCNNIFFLGNSIEI